MTKVVQTYPFFLLFIQPYTFLYPLIYYMSDQDNLFVHNLLLSVLVR